MASNAPSVITQYSEDSDNAYDDSDAETLQDDSESQYQEV